MNPRDGLGKLHGCLIWPRRRGKDLTGLNFMVSKALRRVGNYYYFFPTYRLGKRVIWDGKDDQGIPYRSYIPGEIVEDENETEMQITLSNGSLLYVLGADNVDMTARGTNVVGALYSEYRDISPDVRRTIAPILANNNGWELIITTPRGHNHLYDLVQKITKDPVLKDAWYYDFHTIETCSLGPEDLARMLKEIDMMRREGTPEEWIQQEYYCDFAGFQEGSFFGEGLARVYRENRVCDLPVYAHLPVHTVSDLGTGLSFATWYWQEVGDWIHLIDFSELPSGGIPEFRHVLDQRAGGMGYVYGDHFAPHDVKSTDIGTGHTRLETGMDLAINWLDLPKIKAVGDRVNAGRLLLPRCKFDITRCQMGLSHLLNYRREFDVERETYIEKEVHDKHSHGGAAFTYLAMSVSEIGASLRKYSQVETNFDEFDYNRKVRQFEDPYAMLKSPRDGYG